MNDSNPNQPVEPPVTSLAGTLNSNPVTVGTSERFKKVQPGEGARVDPVSLLFALASQVRWRIVQYLADGRAANGTEIASAIGHDRDATAKQLRLLRDSGVLESPDSDNRRQTLYQIPASRRPSPGVLDFGFCVLDLKKV